MTNFKQGSWNRFVDVHDFILRNYTPYDGDESFLTAPTQRTQKLWQEVLDLM